MINPNAEIQNSKQPHSEQQKLFWNTFIVFFQTQRNKHVFPVKGVGSTALCVKMYRVKVKCQQEKKFSSKLHTRKI